MSVIYIPCLNVDAPDTGGGLSVGVSAGTVSTDGGVGIEPAIEVSHPDIPFTLKIVPVYPFITIGINWQFWKDLFGLGETRIEREKEQIQDVYTPILRFMKKNYGFPLRDGHALQFSSDHFKKYMEERPDLDWIRPSMYQAAQPLAQSVFVDDSPSQGQRERIVNQFLANAADNEWPLNATIYAWNGILEAANPNCRSDQGRFMRNPDLVETIAKYAVLLQYMPLANFASAVAEHKVADKTGRKLLTHWLNNPQLVASIPPPTTFPDWAVAYKSPEFGGGQSGNPYETQQIAEREPILQLWEGVQFQRPWYPDLVYVLNDGLKPPTLEIPPAQPPSVPPGQQPPPPWGNDNDIPVPPPDPVPTPWPQDPNCPPYQPPPQPPPPQPNPQPPTDPDTGCSQPCQDQIDYLLNQVQMLNNWVLQGILPRLDNLDAWTTDIEHRVPGPMPPLPTPTEYPPWIPNIPDDPGDIPYPPPVEPPPGTEPPPFPIPEDCLQKLLEMCDDDLFCEKVRNCERQWKCEDLTFCDETGGPWAAMAECWLSKNTNNPPSVEGDRAGRNYPQFTVQSMLIAFSSLYQGQGQGQGQGSGGTPIPSEQSPQGEPWAIVKPYRQMLVDSWDGTPWQTIADPNPLLEERGWIYADPEATEVAGAKILQPILRTGEFNPCTGQYEGVLEIPGGQL